MRKLHLKANSVTLYLSQAGSLLVTFYPPSPNNSINSQNFVWINYPLKDTKYSERVKNSVECVGGAYKHNQALERNLPVSY